MNTKCILTAFLVTLLLGVANRQISAKPPTKEEVQQANALARKLTKLDDEARDAFAKEHPGVLPESSLRLPKASIVAFDWTNLNKVSAWHHQRAGDCWANSATEALECSYLIRNGSRVTLSPQPVLDHLKLGAAAAQMSDQPGKACEYFLTTGTTGIANYPYSGKPEEPKDLPLPYRAVAWGFVAQDDQPPTAEQLKAALLQYGPLAIDLTCTAKFKAYQGGLFNEQSPIDKKGILGKHAVLLVGWDDSRGACGAWKIKNSWGPMWGEQGFMWIARGSNDIARHAEWVCAASSYYSLPADAFAQLVPDAKSLPAVHYAAVSRTDRTSEPISSTVSRDSHTASPASPTSLVAVSEK